MFEGGMFPRVPAGGAVGAPGAPAGPPTSVPPVSAEDAAVLLASLGAGGVLAGVVEGLLARLLVTAQDSDDEGSAADGVGGVDGEGLFTSEPGGDAAMVTAAKGLRTMDVEEAGASGLIGLGAAGLGELAAACHRLAAWAAWGESLAAACLTGCAELSTHPGQWGPNGQVSPVVGYEERKFNTTCLLSVRLGISRTRAGQMVDHGNALMNIGFGPVEAMERSGVLDSTKASLVTRRLEDVPVPVALEVQNKVLPQAPRRTVSQVGRDIERALIEVDPDGHDERTRANVSRRCVSRPKPAGEGLCQVRLLLPTMDALLLDSTLDAIAASARAAGEERTPGQLRADAITAMTLSTLRTSQQTAYQSAVKASDVRDGVPTSLDDGSGGIDGDLSTLGSVPHSWASPNSPVPGRLLPDGVPLEGLLSSLSGLVSSVSPWWTPSGTGHLPLPASIHINVNVTVPLTSLVPPGDPDGSDDPGGGDRADGPYSLDSSRTSPDGGHATVLEPSDRESSEISGRSLPESRQDVPAAQSVAEVRIGARSVPVPAMTAWALAAGGTWRRLVTDPVSGVVLDVGRTRYRPPTGLADLVRARDRACVFPTCQIPAERCDLDHLTVWGQGGTTSLDNLATLCEAHHRLKHTPGWALTRDQTSGDLSWHTPDKTVYQRHLDGTIDRLPRKVGPRQHLVPSTVIPDGLSKQIGPDLIDRLNTALDHTHPGNGSARLVTRGPRPGEKAGDFETAPYPRAAHTLGLAPLIDQAPSF